MTSVCADPAVVRHAWRSVCRHTIGIALGTTIRELAQRGVFERLAHDSEIAVFDLAPPGAQSGPFQAALRALASIGWLDRRSDGAIGPATRYALSARGRRFLPYLNYYTGDADCADLDRADPIAFEVMEHALGLPLASAVVDLKRGGMEHARLCRDQGWIGGPNAAPHLEPLGECMLAMAPQYFYPLSYLATFRRAGDILFGAGPNLGESKEEETHVDRALDIDFSGRVFSNNCRGPFLDAVRAAFDKPLAEQPAAIVDTGCGDGAMLREVWRFASNVTRRPLMAVGVEPSGVARRTAAARLAAEEIPHLVIDGDIGEPERLAENLRTHGIDAEDALHISKSVIHNRTHTRCDGAPPFDCRSTAMGVAPDGGFLTAAEVAASLWRLFRRWIPLIHRHGMLVLEAHTTAPECAAAHVEHSIMAAVDLSHAYSCQYLVEPEVFRGVARAAGLRSAASHDFGAASVGHVTMTLDHFTAA